MVVVVVGTDYNSAFFTCRLLYDAPLKCEEED